MYIIDEFVSTVAPVREDPGWQVREEESQMLNKEEILLYVQQGQALPGWQVFHPRAGYLLWQTVLYTVLALASLIGGILFITQADFVVVAYSGLGISTSTWRIIDITAIGLFFVIFTGLALSRVIDLNTIHEQVLVLMPEGFFLKKRKAEQLIFYAGASSILPRSDRSGDVKLSVHVAGTNTIATVEFDNSYGNARKLAAQIVAAHHQYMANQQPGMARQ